MNTKQLGDRGEDYACEYIRKLGMTVLTRNFRYGKEEVDIIAQDGEVLVFVEVKARADWRHGLPEEAVTPSKQRSIIRTALWYMKQNHLLDSRVRFDVAAILNNELKYYKNAFDATGVC